MAQENCTLKLSDGRTLGYAEFGSPSGKPVIIQHGMACSRIDGLYYHGVGLQLGARIIGIDRPGMGLSTAQPNRTLHDSAKDVEQLTDHLGLQSYSVMGISGGGPSTLACARYLPPTKLKAVAMVVALGPPDIGMRGARLINRLGYPYGHLYCPEFLHRWFWRRDAIGRVELSDDERWKMLLDSTKGMDLPEKDRLALKNTEYYRIGLRSTREGFAQGYGGCLLDGKLCCRPFTFKVEDIPKHLPVRLWYGSQDVFVPANHGVQLAKRLGSRAELKVLDETHVSLTQNWRKEILEDLLKAME